ncbi:MAG: replication initiator protein [Microviridae sp.]|nr:MAG: replication initiator protein [Microviridae sp.]
MNYMNCAPLKTRPKRPKEGSYEASTDEEARFQKKLQKRRWEPSEEPRRPPDAGGLADLVACFHPLTAWRKQGGGITFTRGDAWSDRPLEIQCGKCRGCRVEKSRQWALRCVHEQQMHDRNSFITLTYNPESMPADGSLNIKHWQLFAKKLRHRIGPFRFFMCGEYTEKKRPHYHAAIFGVDFTHDREHFRMSKGNPLYRSGSLEAAWGRGYAAVGELTYESAAYVAGYIQKKISPGHDEASRAKFRKAYERTNPDGTTYLVKPEFVSMSRRPGLGTKWFEEYRTDVYPEDEIIHRGRRFRPPRFYDEKLSEEELKKMKLERVRKVLLKSEELTPERLETRERCLEEKLKAKQRNLET